MAKKLKVHEFLERAIEISGKTQAEIARDIGYARPNIISMMKKGVTKVPIDKIPALSTSLGIDPVQLLRLAMHEYQPEVWETITKVMGEIPTADEVRALEALRETAELKGGDLEKVEKRDYVMAFESLF